MNKRTNKKIYKIKQRNIVINHIRENINIYICVLILFVIGLLIGIILINNASDNQLQNVREYINNSISLLKTRNNISKSQLLKKSIGKNIVIIFAFWIFGLTFLGKYLIYLAIFLLGLMFGYTTSAILLSFNIEQSLILIISTLLFQNVFFIPTMIVLSVCGIKCQNEFLETRNLKYIFVKYTIYIILAFLPLIISSLIETYISGNLINVVVKYL